jgi:ribulose 1,5-bisphosphate synthetase/thiazole synthase
MNAGVTATLLERPGEASAYVLAQLKYLDVCVKSNDGVIPMRALADNGAEICVAHRRIFDGIGYHTCGRIRLRGIVGNPVEAELANITIQLNDNPECSMIVLCAVCDELNEELILTQR